METARISEGLMSKQGAHCPGPPTSGSDQANLQQQLQVKEQEVKHLKQEIQFLFGKIKGYQTLSHLFQESKQESMRYKQLNEELASKLDGLMKRLAPESITSRNDFGFQTSSVSSQQHELQELALRQPSSDGKSPTSSMQLSNLHFESPALLKTRVPGANSFTSLKFSTEFSVSDAVAVRPPGLPKPLESSEQNKVSPGAKKAELQSDRSTDSSPSFVELNSSDAEPSKSLQSGTFSANKQPVNDRPVEVFSRTEAELNRGEVNLSMEIQHLTDHLQNLGKSTDTSSIQDLSADLIKTSITAMKLEKRSRVQQVMIDQLSAQIATLQAESETKNRTIQLLQDDRAALMANIERLEAARREAMQEVQAKYTESNIQPGPEEHISAEWVEVEKQTAGGITKESGAGETVTAISTTEAELRRRVEKLNATICELVSVNRSWDEHCKQLELSHGQQLSALQAELAAAQHRLDEFEQSDHQRQLEFDRLLLNAKKQREADEMEKEEALTQLHREKQQRLDAEQKCVQFSAKTVELESRLLELHSLGRRDVLQLQSTSQPGSMEQASVGSQQQEVMTELQILRQQVTIFKEDFDHERRDREITRDRMEKLQAELNETAAKLITANSHLQQVLPELETLKRENRQLSENHYRMVNEVQMLQQQARPSFPPPPSRYHPTQPAVIHPPVHSSPQRTVTFAPQPAYEPPHLTYEPPRQTRNAYIQLESVGTPMNWPCPTCTFENHWQRSSCEICGKYRGGVDVPDLRPRGDGGVTTGLGGTVAGLPYRSSAASFGLLGSRHPLGSLESDNLPTTGPKSD